MSHRIEAAKSARSACVTCGEKIGKGEVRVAELYQDASRGAYVFEERRSKSGDRYRERQDGREAIHRYHHLACAATAHPSVVATALRAQHDPALIGDRAALDAQLAAGVEAERKARIEAATHRIGMPDAPAAEDPRLEEVLATLADDPDDLVGIQAIGDLLAGHGDPQGELIALQLALANTKVEREQEREGFTQRGQQLATRTPRDRAAPDNKRVQLLQQRDELMARIVPRLDSADRTTWGVGFVRRLELGSKSCERLLELANLWRHPTMRVLTELRLDLPPRSDLAEVHALLAQVLPRSLRRLELGGRGVDPGAIAPTLAALPRLTHLVLFGGRRGDPRLAHPTLTDLALHGDLAGDAIATLSCESLPAVRGLEIRGWGIGTDPLAILARTPWVARLERLHLDAAYLGQPNAREISAAAVADLRTSLGGRKLARVQITGVPITLPMRAALAELCDELVCPAASVVLDDGTTHVTHANKPEWGRGEIIKRHAGKLEVMFPEAGLKVFKADAPFLVPA